MYPKDLTPDEIINSEVRDSRSRHYDGSKYPFGVFLDNPLGDLEFKSITIFCGVNRSGKTTALNVIAQKLGLKHDSSFNSGRFFQNYLNFCDYSYLGGGMDEYVRRKSGNYLGSYLPSDSRIIVSDDVFAYSMRQRKINEGFLRGRADALDNYDKKKGKAREVV